jgi:CheY-like chemotaxis protein
MKIMVVDDQPEILALIKSMMEPLGCEVFTLTDSREAAQRAKAQSFDAVFVDVRMPHLDGFDLTRSIRSSPVNGQVPIVMLTGSDDVQTMQLGFKAGATYFLGKPISQERIQSLFNAVLGPMQAQKRKHARLPFQTMVNCSSATGSERQFIARSLNIGEGGMLLEGSKSVGVAQSMTVEFSLASSVGRRQLQLFAKVQRLTPPDRFSLEFIDLPDSDREAIRAFIVGEVRR